MCPHPLQQRQSFQKSPAHFSLVTVSLVRARSLDYTWTVIGKHRRRTKLASTDCEPFGLFALIDPGTSGLFSKTGRDVSVGRPPEGLPVSTY